MLKLKNLRRNIKNFKYYKNVLKSNKDILEKNYNIRIDFIWRLYTIYNIDPAEYKTYGEDKIIYDNINSTNFQHLNKSDALLNGEDIFELKIKKELSKLNTFLSSIGLTELYGISDKKRLDKYNYRIIIRFKYLDTKFWANIFLFMCFSIISGLIVGLILLLF